MGQWFNEFLNQTQASTKLLQQQSQKDAHLRFFRSNSKYLGLDTINSNSTGIKHSTLLSMHQI